MGSERILSKWSKTRMMAGSAKLSACLPETKRMNEAALGRMLDRYGLVYVKPEIGSMGVGVMRVEKAASGGRSAYRIHAGTRRVERDSLRRAYDWIAAHKLKRPYLVQRGVRVIRHKGRPVDFRVMIQRRKDRAWEVSGMLARAAHPLKAVTNGSQGGSIHEARRVLASALGERSADRLQRQFRELAGLTAARLSRAKPGLNELGLDIAVDGQRRMWILEVNTHPDPRPFKLLPDSDMLRRIVRLGKGYGRVYNLKVTKARRG